MIKNDYLFTMEICNIKGGCVRVTKRVVSADNVEEAQERLEAGLKKNSDKIRSIIDVRKL
jgi:hypothetical protein